MILLNYYSFFLDHKLRLTGYSSDIFLQLIFSISFINLQAQAVPASAAGTEIPEMDKPIHYTNVVAAELFNNLTASKGDLKVVPTVFDKFIKLTRSVPHAIDILEHPLVTEERRKAFILNMVKHFGGDKAIADTIYRINRDGQFPEVPDILKEFSKKASDVLKETTAVITSAEPLTKEALKTIEKGLTSQVKKGYKLTIVEKVDPKLLAGFVVDMDDMNQDLSLSSYVANIDKMISEAIEVAKI